MPKRNRLKAGNSVRAEKSQQRQTKEEHDPSGDHARGRSRRGVAGLANMGRRLRLANSGHTEPRRAERKAARPVKRQSSQYEDWTKEELYEKAKKSGLEGRSRMSRDELAKALARG
jgi:hypothetical protein